MFIYQESNHYQINHIKEIMILFYTIVHVIGIFLYHHTDSYHLKLFEF